MDYRNLIKNNLKKEKMVEEMKETVKGTSKDIVSFFKHDIVGFVKDKAEVVGEVYNAKKEDLARKSIYAYAISEVEKFIVKCNPSVENPVVITKREIGDTDKTLSIAQILATYEMETDDKYINVIFDVLKIHFEYEAQLNMLSEDDRIIIFVKEEVVGAEVSEEVSKEISEEVIDEVIDEVTEEVVNEVIDEPMI